MVVLGQLVVAGHVEAEVGLELLQERRVDARLVVGLAQAIGVAHRADEVTGGTDPLNPDSDGDGILDGTEIGMTEPVSDDTDPTVFVPDLDPNTTTDPLDPDTDRGGVSDGVEDANHNGRVDPGEPDPNITDDDFPETPLDLSGLTAQGSGGCAGGDASAWALFGGLAFALVSRRTIRRV